MINLTLTITAAPELLAVMTGFTSAITAAKVNLIPEYSSEFMNHKDFKQQTAIAVPYGQPASQIGVNNGQNASARLGVEAQQAVQTQAPAGITTRYTEPNTVQIYDVNSPVTSVPAYGVQAGHQTPLQSAPAQGASVPTSVQSYTMEQLAVAATQLVDAGRREELVNLLKSFGVQALTALSKEQYGAFATQLRQLGVKL